MKCPKCDGSGVVPDVVAPEVQVQGAGVKGPGSEQVVSKFLDEGLDVRKPAAASLASSLGKFSQSSAKLARAREKGGSAKEELHAILEGDPDFEGWVRDVWEKFFLEETEDFCRLLVGKFERHLPARPGAYLSAVARAKGRWVKAA